MIHTFLRAFLAIGIDDRILNRKQLALLILPPV